MALFVSAQIENKGTAVMPWTVIGIESTTTVDEFIKLALSLYDNNSTKDNVDVRVLVGESRESTAFQIINVTDTTIISRIVDIFGRYFKLRIGLREDKSSEKQRLDDSSTKGDHCLDGIEPKNAFSVLMQPETSAFYPSKKPEVTKKQKLFNLLIDFLVERKLGFSPQIVESHGRDFVQIMTNILWYVGPHCDKLQARSCYIPQEFTVLNDPISSKHSITPLDSRKLLDFAVDLDRLSSVPWINRSHWHVMKKNVVDLADSLQKYVSYLETKRAQSSRNHSSLEPVRTPARSENYKVIEKKTSVKLHFKQKYKQLNEAIEDAPPYHPLDLDDFIPGDTRDRRYFLDCLHEGIEHTCSLFSHAYGNSLGTYYFIWKHSPSDTSANEMTTSNMRVIDKLKKDLLSYHTRAMKKKFSKICGLVCPGAKPMYLRWVYADITGDSSSSVSSEQAIIDERVDQMLRLEDFSIVSDLRKHNSGRPPVYEQFFDKCAEYLRNTVEESCDDRRHDAFTYLATAISVRDLKENVSKICDPYTPIPSDQWLRLQFAPKVPSSVASLQFTGRLNIRYMVQSRIFHET